MHAQRKSCKQVFFWFLLVFKSLNIQRRKHISHAVEIPIRFIMGYGIQFEC